jgi:diacylglycerol kinase family enzyme
VELAVLPAGTLNHFAKDHGIPVDPAAALELATTGSPRPVDGGYVDGRLFLKTSSVGEYVSFVRTRDALQVERRMGYGVASLVASWRVFRAARPLRLELDLAGRRRLYRTTLAFVGVGERELQFPVMGGRVTGGRRGLHVIIPRARTGARLLFTALVAALRGVRAAKDDLQLDSFLVERCRIVVPRHHLEITADGELAPCDAPLEYRVARDALRVVTAESEAPRLAIDDASSLSSPG